jgi:hypothetical protein
VRQEGQAVPHVHVVEEAGARVVAGHDRRAGPVRYVQNPQAAADPIDHHVHVVALDPEVVDARAEARGEPGDDGGMGRVSEVEERNAVQTIVGALMGDHADGAIGPDLHIVYYPGIHEDAVRADG